MNEHFVDFLSWIERSFGMAGWVCALLLSIAAPIVIMWLLHQAPIPKGQPLCNFCRYENPNENSKVYCCQHYTKCSAFQVRAAECPHKDI